MKNRICLLDLELGDRVTINGKKYFICHIPYVPPKTAKVSTYFQITVEPAGFGTKFDVDITLIQKHERLWFSDIGKPGKDGFRTLWKMGV